MDLLQKYSRGILLSLVFGAVVFIILSFWSGFGEVVEELKQFNWWLVPVVVALAFANYLVRFAKFHYYVRVLDIDLNKKDSFSIFLSGLVMSVTPGKFGEVLKSVLIKSVNGTPISRSAPIVLAERFTDFVALALMSLLGIYYYAFGVKTYFVSAALILCPMLLVSSKWASHGLIRILGRLPGLSKAAPKMLVAYESTASLLSVKNLFMMTLVSIVSWFCECVAFYLVCNGFSGTPVPILGLTFVYSFSILLGAIMMLPGGIGATEASLTGLMVTAMGMVRSTAVAATFIVRACTIWFAVLIGAMVLMSFQKRLNPKAVEEITETQ